MFYLCAATSFRRFATRATEPLRWKQFSWQKTRTQITFAYGYGRPRVHCNIERSANVVGFKSARQIASHMCRFVLIS